MKKTFIILLTAFLTLMNICSVVSAADDVKVYIDGTLQHFEQPPVIENGNTLVPLRAIFEALGAKITWDDESKNAEVIKGDKVLILAIGTEYVSTGVYDDGKIRYTPDLIKLEVPPKLINNTTMVPLRFASENLGCKVLWDASNKAVRIYSNPNDPNYLALKDTLNNNNNNNNNNTDTNTSTIDDNDTVNPMDSFNVYKVDGFIIQVPKAWKRVYSVASSKAETHYLVYKDDITYSTTLTIKPYDKVKDYDYVKFAHLNSSQPFGEFKKIDVKNADIAYQSIDYKDSISQDSRNTIVAFRGNLCYILDAKQKSLSDVVHGSNVDRYTKEIIQYKANIMKMFSSFMLSKKPIDFKTIISTTTNEQDYLDQMNNVVRSNTTPIDKYGKLIKVADIVNSGGFSGKVKETSGSKIFVSWDSKSDFIPDTDVDYWATIAGIKYKSESWIESVEVRIEN